MTHAAAFDRFKPAGQIIGHATGEILERFDVIFAKAHQHGRRDAVQYRQIIGNAHLFALRIKFFIYAVQMVAGPILNLFRRVLVKTFNIGDLFKRHISHFLDRRKALRGQQLGNHLIDIQRAHEQARALGKFRLTPLAFLRFRHDINVPTGQLRRKAHILTAAANGEAQLLIGHHHFNPLHILVEHHFGHLGRRQSIDDKGGRITRPRNYIDLFALQFIDHGLDTAAAHTDTCADRINARIVRNHADFGARTGVTGNRAHFDDAVVNFRHFLHE